MKGVCSYCEKHSDELESWGLTQLCPSCADDYRDEFPSKIKKSFSDIKIEKPKSGSNAQYAPKTGLTEFTTMTSPNIPEIINHEFMHFILHKMIGIQCCYQYDSIEDHIDEFHDSWG